MSEHPAPTPPQRAAIDDRERDLFLVAGAGTGKTRVLVDRFCDAVCASQGPDAETGIDAVLAFTFTDRAAGELKRRIRTELTRRADATSDPTGRNELRALAREAEGAWITTVHGFCQRILSSHPLEAGLDPRYRVIDEAESGRLAAEAFDAAFAGFAALGEDRNEMSAAFGVDDLRATVVAAYAELRSQGYDHPRLPKVAPADPVAAARRVHAAAGAALDATAEAKHPGKRPETLAAVFAVTDGTVPKEEEITGWKDVGATGSFEIAEVEEFNVAVKALGRAVVEDAYGHHVGYLGELLGFFGDQYERRKRERSGLDFEDLQLVARRLLRENRTIRASLQERFRHVMMDEFQDTNRLQASLVELLHRADDGTARNRLFTVGDELQSIYRFRHADVAVFREGRDRAAAAPDNEAGVRELVGNFRSQPGIVDAVNAVGAKMIGNSYLPLEAARAGGGPGNVELVVFDKDAVAGSQVAGPEISRDETAQPWRVAEAQALARRLAELVAGGVSRGDIVVLLRTYTHVDAYEHALYDAGLRPYVIGDRGYWSRQPVTDTLNLLACVANPADDYALLGALASPACGLSSDALWLLAKIADGLPIAAALRHATTPAGAAATGGLAERATKWDRHFPEDDLTSMTSFVATLESLRARVTDLSLEALIDEVVDRTGYDLAMLARPRGRRRMANVRKLMALARDYEASEGRDLRGFLDFASDEGASKKGEPEATIQAESHDGVRVMTIHGSKGLEFPVVAVADLGRGLAVGRIGRLQLAGDPDSGSAKIGVRLARLGRPGKQIFDFAEIADAGAEAEREEERRLLHVAMTRAEDHLVLSGAISLAAFAKQPNKTEALIGGILRALEWSLGDAEAMGIPVSLVEVVDSRQLPAGLDLVASAEPEVEISAALADPDLGPPARAGHPAVDRISYSALSDYERCGYGFYVRRVLGLAPRPEGHGRRRAAASSAAAGSGASSSAVGSFGAEGGEGAPVIPADELVALENRFVVGNIVHAALEGAARAVFAEPSDEVLEALAEREGVGTASTVLDRARALTSAFLDSEFGAEVRAARSARPEVPFSFRLGPLVVRGEIDLLVESDDEVLVIDYKTDSLGDADPADLVEGYDVQRKIYALAALRRFGQPVRVVYLFLERPDEPVESRFEPVQIPALTGALERLSAGIVAGRFEVTSSPNRTLCFDCPARQRLCVHPKSLTLAE